MMMMRSSAASALRICFIALAIGVGSTAVFAAPSSDQNAEEARWVVHENTWGYMSTLDSDTHQPTAQVASFSDGALNASTGRLFFYLMTEDPVSGPGRRTTSGDDNIKSFAAALTLSEAATDPTRYNSGGSHCGARLNIDPEDPRCAKLTLSGQVAPVSSGADIAAGKAALFARHPQMAGWPGDHGFRVFAMNISDIWMISSYGGGSTIQPSDYYRAKPKHIIASQVYPSGTNPPPAAEAKPPSGTVSVPPPWKRYAARARWLVYHSVWSAVSTVSVRLHGAPWGNVRSIADGVGRNSTGLPFLYIPTPDPSAIDVQHDANVTLSFTEAALGQRVVNGSQICGGMDAEDPTCGRIHLSGRLVALAKLTDIARAEASLGTRHPNAPWLAQGGAHTGGKYYTLELKSIMFLDMYGGPAKLTVREYLDEPSPSMH